MNFGPPASTDTTAQPHDGLLLSSLAAETLVDLAVACSPAGCRREVLDDLCMMIASELDLDAHLAASTELVVSDDDVRFGDPSRIAATLDAHDAAALQQMHAQLADSIGVVALDPARVAREVAFHRAQSGDVERAVALLLEAALLHEVAGRYDIALSCLHDAAECDTDIVRRRSTMLRRARLAVDCGEADAAAAWEALLDAALEHPCARDLEARAHYQLYWLTDGDVAANHLARAAALGDDAAGWAERAQALECIIEADNAAAIAHDRVAISRARRHGDRSLEALARLGMAISFAQVGDMDDAITAQRASIDIASANGDRRTVVTGRLNLITMLFEHLDLDAAAREAEALRAYVAEHQLAHWNSEVFAQQSAIAAQRGELAEAAELASAAIDALDETATIVDQAFVSNLRIRVALDTGAADLASQFDQISPIMASCGVNALTSGLRLHELRMLAATGAIDEMIVRARQLDLPVEERALSAAGAIWLTRTGMLLGSEELIDIGVDVAGTLDGATARNVVLCADEVEATTAAHVTGDVAPLATIVERWTAASCKLDAADVTAVIGVVHHAHGRSLLAERALRDASRMYVEIGAHSRLETMARLLPESCALPAAAASAAGDDARADCQLLLNVGADVRSRFDQHAISRSFAAGQLFFSPEDEHASVMVIRSGRVRLYGMTEDGKRLTIALLDPGAVFGENAVLGQPCAGLYAEADEDVVADVIPADRMRELMRADPRLGLNLLAMVGSRLRRSQELTQQVAFWTVQQRVERLIVDLDAQYGHPTLDGYRIINRVFTHADIAEMVNARRETVGELFKQLRAAGTIELRKRRIVIIDAAALSAGS